MAPRPLWSGTLAFGLVSVPVRIHSAIAEHRLHFHLIHEPDDGPIGYQKVCKLEDKAVPDDEIVKAFEVRKGDKVRLTDEDFELARAAAGDRTVEITDFVPYEDIDPILFAKAYYVGPGEDGERVYSLLARAMEDSGLAAVVTFVIRDRRHLGAIRAKDGLMVLEQLYYADEQRAFEEIKPPRGRPSKHELELAATLIASYKGPWRPEKYKDTYRDELCALIKAKRGGKAPAAPEVKAEEPADLMEALRQSIEAGREASRPRRQAAPRRASSARRSRGRAAR